MDKKYLRVLNGVIQLSSAEVLKRRLRSSGLQPLIEKQLHTKLGGQRKYPMGVFAVVHVTIDEFKMCKGIHGEHMARRPDIMKAILEEYPHVIEALYKAKVLDDEEE